MKQRVQRERGENNEEVLLEAALQRLTHSLASARCSPGTITVQQVPCWLVVEKRHMYLLGLT